MNVKFDHLVHLTNNPEAVQETFETYGFTTIKGGHHTNWGTHNSLCYFNNLGYIEWIGFIDLDVAKGSDNVLIQQIFEDANCEEGFSQLAFRTNDMAGVQASLHQRGFETIGPVAGNRKKADGTMLNWSMLFIKEKTEEPFRYPFFIEWGQSDEIRKTDMNEIMKHDNGAPSISYISYIVDNVEETVSKYCKLFELNSSACKREVDEWGAFIEIALVNLSLRFYQSLNGSPIKPYRPFLCGIAGVDRGMVPDATIDGGTYRFFK